MKTTEQSKLATRSEAAQILNISTRKLDMLIADGDLPVVRIGRSVRVKRTVIDWFIEQCEV